MGSISDKSSGTSLEWENIRYLFLFGDSYTATGFSVHSRPPDDEEPFGNPPYPGITHHEGPTWAVYLATEFTSSVLAYNYAVSGHTVPLVGHQIRDKFLATAGQKPLYAPWTSENSLFVTWIGVNDVARGANPATAIPRLFQYQEDLHKAGARKFLFLTVPPLDLTPGGREWEPRSNFSKRVLEWNEELRKQCDLFKAKHDDIFVEVYDTTTIFKAVQQNPDEYGLADTEDESTDLAHRMWYDGFHASAAMHKILASDVSLFLEKFK